MGGIQFQTPEKFNFRQPDEWPHWCKHFKQFHITSGLSTESQAHQVNTLLFCLGEEAEDLLRSTNITDDKRKEYISVLEKFDGFFQVRKNTFSKEPSLITKSNSVEKLPFNLSCCYTTLLKIATIIP